MRFISELLCGIIHQRHSTPLEISWKFEFRLIAPLLIYKSPHTHEKLEHSGQRGIIPRSFLNYPLLGNPPLTVASPLSTRGTYPLSQICPIPLFQGGTGNGEYSGQKDSFFPQPKNCQNLIGPPKGRSYEFSAVSQLVSQ